MKTLKIIVATFLGTAVLTIGFSVGALTMLPGTKIADEPVVVPQPEPAKQESIEAKKEVELTATELRFRAIEARLSALENK